MKSIDKFEERLKALKEQNESDAPPYVWDNINKELGGDQSNNRWMFWICLLVFCFGAGIYIGSQKFANTQDGLMSEYAAENSDFLEDKDGTIQTSEILQSGKKNENEIELSSNGGKQIGDRKSVGRSSQNLEERVSNVERDAQLKSFNKITTDNRGLQKDISSSNGLIKNIHGSNENSNFKITDDSKKPKLADVKLLRDKIDEDKNKNINGLEYSKAHVASKSVLDEKNMADAKHLSLPPSSKIASRPVTNVINRLPIVSFVLESEERLVVARKLPPLTECPTFSCNQGRKYFVEFSLNIGKHNNALAFLDRASPHYYLRQASESSWYAVGSKVELGMYLTKNLYVKTGLELGIAKDKFYHVNEAISQVIITYDEETGIPIDTRVVNGRKESKGDVTFNTIDIPLNLGYSVEKKSLQFGVETGPLFNIKMGAEGRIFNENSEISSIEEEGDIYKSQLGLGWSGALVVKKKIGTKNYLTFKPSFKTYLNPITSDTYSFSSKLSYYRVEVGFQHNF